MLANIDDIFLTREQAEEDLGVHVLGMIPHVESEEQRRIKNIYQPLPLTDPFRALRNNLYFATLDRPIRTLLVTSSVPAEGKSTVVANLAMALALENKKVVIVDTDMRRPTLNKLFGVPAVPGLTDVLVGTHSVAEVIRETTEPRVRLIPVGSIPPNPTELISSPALGALLDGVSAHCDIVLLDSPPLLFVPDSPMLAHRVDGVLLVIGENTLRRSARMSMTLLSRARANVVGTAFNHLAVDFGNGYYYTIGTENPEGESVADS
jgi:capsular exopolysaccharide synthesis family protein